MTSPHGNNYHYSDHVDSGTYAFTAAETGDYMACFWAPDHRPPVTLSVDFDWKSGVAAKDWSKVAKKGQVDVSTFTSLLYIPLSLYKISILSVDSVLLRSAFQDLKYTTSCTKIIQQPSST